MVRSKERMPASTWPTGNPRLGRRQRPGEGRVGVAVDERERGLELGQHGLQRRQDARRLGGVRAGSGAQLAGGARHVELLEEDPRELVVVVLAGVDDQLVEASREACARPLPPSRTAAGYR